MKARSLQWIAMLALGCSSVSVFAQSCGETVPQVRKDYFAKIGIGADYGPHYPCYTNGAVADCWDYQGNRTSAEQDAKNYEFQASVRLDMSQLKLAGFNTVRSYGDAAKVWIAMINRVDEINKLSTSKLSVVYQVSTCKSDAVNGPNGVCLNAPSLHFQDVVNFSETQLKQVIQQVTPAKFQRVVKLIIVGNEDLVKSPENGNYNTQDLINAINQTKTELTNDGITVNNGSNGGVDLSSATVIGQMSSQPGMTLAAAYPPGSPVIENIYPQQFAGVNTPAAAIANLKTFVANMQSHYPDRSAMLGETGWWTAGQDAGYENSGLVGTLPDAVNYYKLLYAYVKPCSVPTLIFEFYDQPTKSPTSTKPNPPNSQQAEEHYGVFNAFNSVKDRAMLPNPASGNFDYNTSQAAIFTFSPAPGDASTAPPMTIAVQQPGESSPTKFTIQPFSQVNPTGISTGIWPTFNLYVGSKVSLYRSVSGPAQCSNQVVTVYPNPPNGAAPYAGGVWQYRNVTAPGCPDFTDKAVNWADGQTVYLPNKFIIPKP